jgi:hypothetical protein
MRRGHDYSLPLLSLDPGKGRDGRPATNYAVMGRGGGHDDIGGVIMVMSGGEEGKFLSIGFEAAFHQSRPD